jgi:hypothetical protein
MTSSWLRLSETGSEAIVGVAAASVLAGFRYLCPTASVPRRSSVRSLRLRVGCETLA